MIKIYNADNTCGWSMDNNSYPYEEWAKDHPEEYGRHQELVAWNKKMAEARGDK